MTKIIFNPKNYDGNKYNDFNQKKYDDQKNTRNKIK